MIDQHRSSIATQVEDLVSDRPRVGPVWGLCVHTSGRSIVQRAIAARARVLEYVVGYYRAAPYSCHYVIGWSGEIVQITPDDRRVPHVGVSTEERQSYLSGRWHEGLPLGAVRRWGDLWGRGSPQHLFPGRSANSAYVGVELPPLLTPGADGTWYTLSQHEAVARLAEDLRVRHGWPDWPSELPCPRLLGHEDLDAYGRWDRDGGWDPGALRALPRFRWGLVAEAMV